MKASTVRLLCFTGGVFLLWLVCFMVAYSFYAGVVEVQVAVVEGGAYRSQLFSDVGTVIMIVLAFLGAFLIAVGLTEEEKKKQEST